MIWWCCKIFDLQHLGPEVLWSSAEGLELLFSGPGVSATYRLLAYHRDASGSGGAEAEPGVTFRTGFWRGKQQKRSWRQFLGGFATRPGSFFKLLKSGSFFWDSQKQIGKAKLQACEKSKDFEFLRPDFPANFAQRHQIFRPGGISEKKTKRHGGRPWESCGVAEAEQLEAGASLETDLLYLSFDALHVDLCCRHGIDIVFSRCQSQGVVLGWSGHIKHMLFPHE